jgi:hypothetical protein
MGMNAGAFKQVGTACPHGFPLGQSNKRTAIQSLSRASRPKLT